MVTQNTTARAVILVLVGACVLTAAPGVAGAADISVNLFESVYMSQLPLRAGSLALADFTGDGQMDAALAGTFIAGIVIVPNGGTPFWVAAGDWPVALAAADLDGDDDVDLAVLNRNSRTLVIYTNPGNGQLASSASYQTGAGPTAVAAVDLDGDDRVDLVVANRWDETVTVFRNTGTGFAAVQTLDVPGEPNALVVAPLDAGDSPDVAVACATDDAIRVLLNTGGVLAVAGSFAGGPYPVGIAAADLNGDAKVDLVAADREDTRVTVLLNDGAAGFSSEEVRVAAAGSDWLAATVDVLLVDLDGDEDVDIRVAGRELLNDGNATFALQPYTPLAAIDPTRIYAKGRLPALPGLFAGMVETLVYPSSSARLVLTVNYLAPLVSFNPCDFNGDGDVDVLDLISAVQVAVAGFGQPAGGPGYDARVDWDGNGEIDVFDIVMLIQWYDECISARI